MSISSNEYLNQSRKKLIEALGDKKDDYFFHMKQWFRMKVTKEEFDASARDLLSSESVHLHNEFFMSILTKCQLFLSPALPSTPVSIKIEPQRQEDIPLPDIKRNDTQTTFDSILAQTPLSTINDRKKLKPKKKAKVVVHVTEIPFEPVNIHSIAPISTLREPSALTEASPGYHTRCLHMLDSGPLKGRLLLAAWDHGLTSVAESVATLLQEASKQCMKNILTVVIARRKGYRVREGRFIHSLGTISANPWLRNSAALNDWSSESLGFPFGETESSQHPAWPTVDSAEQNAAQLASCAPAHDIPIGPISAFDLFLALKINKSVLPVHSVYSLGMERISSKLWRPGWSELEQDAISAKETSLRDFVKEQRLATNPF